MLTNRQKIDFQEEIPTSDKRQIDFQEESPEEDLQRKLSSLGLLGQIQQLGGIKPAISELGKEASGLGQELGALGAGGLQQFGRMTQAIPGSSIGLTGLARLIASRPEAQQFIQQYPGAARTGRGIADIAAFSGTAPFLTTGLGAVEVPAFLARLLGSQAAGFLTTPGHRLAGTVMGTVAGVPFERAIPTTLKYIPEGLKGLVGLFKTSKTATKNLLDEIGAGRGIEENAQNLAKQINANKEYFTTESSKNYNSVIKQAGDESIYSGELGKIPGTYQSLYKPQKQIIQAIEKFQGREVPVFKEITEGIPEDSPIKTYVSSIKKAQQDFSKNSNFENAHKLQSTLADSAYKVIKNPLRNIEEKSIARGWLDARNTLTNDIDNFLKTRRPDLANKYENAAIFHKNEVIPYYDKRIRDIASGKVTNPRNLTTIFKNPESDIRKVVDDLGSKGKDQILYNELYERYPTADKVLDNYKKLDEKGLQSYISPKLDQMMGRLRILNTIHKWSKRGAGVAGLGLLAKELIPSHMRKEIF